jgi:hypothetical protein
MPKGRFFKAIFNYLLKDTGLIPKSENAVVSWEGECHSPLRITPNFKTKTSYLIPMGRFFKMT